MSPLLPAPGPAFRLAILALILFSGTFVMAADGVTAEPFATGCKVIGSSGMAAS